MTVIPAAPSSVSECVLYRRLIARSEASDGLAERVAVFVEAVRPLLDLVLAGPFKEYTLHNPAHATKLVHLAEYIIDPATLDELTPLELSVVIFASHLHDLGMCLTQKERAQLLADPRFEEELRAWPQLWHELELTRHKHAVASEPERLSLEMRLFQLQEAGLTAFLRPRHATRERYQHLIANLKAVTGRSDLFSLRGVSFEDELVSICMSHNLDVAVLMEASNAYTERFPRALPIGGMALNTQFCASVLRLIDVLDFDRERTPRVLFESLRIEDRDIPGSAVSLREWNKHMAVHSLEIAADELIVYADSAHPAIEKSIREFCSVMEREIRDTSTVLRKNPESVTNRYRLRLPVVVRPQVRALGYVYKDFTFQLDEAAISRLLMGEALYVNRSVAFRELVQNAIDACRVRQLVDNNSSYSPSVSVSAETDTDGRTWIVVSDNGIGMDESVLSRFFFKVGNSYYESPEFDRLTRAAQHTFAPISRFGIGVLSAFMIGDALELRTRNKLSPRADTAYRTIRVDGRFGLAFVTEQPDGPQGTTVRVRLAERNALAMRLLLGQAAVYLRDAILRPPVPVAVSLASISFTQTQGEFLALREDAVQQLADESIEPVVLDIERWSNRFRGRTILFFRRVSDGQLTRLEWKAEQLYRYLKAYSGNRLTVNGIAMKLRNVGRILGRHTSRIAGVIDVELRGDADIKYDVSRDRLIGEGLAIARRDLRESILAGLSELGIVHRLDSAARAGLEPNSGALVDRKFGRVRPLEDEEVLAAVRQEIPARPWPVGLHRIVAERLGIRPSIAFRAIETLLAAGALGHDDPSASVV
ncbi:MAG: ATP-binding protein [Planctomycetales bacterium]